MRHALAYSIGLLLVVPFGLCLGEPNQTATTENTAPPKAAAALYSSTVVKWQRDLRRYLPNENDISAEVRKAAEEGLPTEYGHFVLPRRKDGSVDEKPNAGMIFAAQYYTAVAKPGSLGGQVVDEANNPIPFATVSARTDFYAGHYAASYSLRPVQADAQGRFNFESVALASYALRPKAVGFAGSDSPLVAVTKDAASPTVTVKMRAAGKLRGTVIGSNGKPAARVSVIVSGIAHGNGGTTWGNFEHSSTSGSDGRFEIAVEEDGLYTLRVEPNGSGTDVPGARTVVYDLPIGQDATIQLLDGGTVAGRIVNRDDGAPLAHVRVTAELADRRSDTYIGGYTVQTDADGRYSFPHLATTNKNEKVLTRAFPRVWLISCRGFRASVEPTEGAVSTVADLAVTTFENWTLSGKVTSTDGEPVTPFKIFVQPVNEQNENYVSWQYIRSKMISANDGSYSLPVKDPGNAVLVRIEAKDFTPYVSPKITPEATKTLDVQMSIAQSVAGTVVDANGNPAAGVEVALSRIGLNLVYFRNGKFDPSGAVLLTKTDDHGRFMLEAQAEPYVVFATSDAGFARLSRDDFEKSRELKLQPWAKIDGTVLVGGKPAVGLTVGVDSQSYMERQDSKHLQIIWMYELKTDEQGKFQFDRVLPSDVTVSQLISTEMPGGLTKVGRAHSAKTTARPGETSTVSLDASGRLPPH